MLSLYGAKHRKRSNPPDDGKSDGGIAIALGSFLDGIPESIVIGLSLLEGVGVSLIIVFAIFLSNIPEGLSSTVGMKKSGRSVVYIFGIWIAITILSALASLLGYSVFQHFSMEIVAATTAIAAGAILAMIVDTMIPEAFEVTHNFAGLVTVCGFFVAFMLSKLG